MFLMHHEPFKSVSNKSLSESVFLFFSDMKLESRLNKRSLVNLFDGFENLDAYYCFLREWIVVQAHLYRDIRKETGVYMLTNSIALQQADNAELDAVASASGSSLHRLGAVQTCQGIIYWCWMHLLPHSTAHFSQAAYSNGWHISGEWLSFQLTTVMYSKAVI